MRDRSLLSIRPASLTQRPMGLAAARRTKSSYSSVRSPKHSALGAAARGACVSRVAYACGRSSSSVPKALSVTKRAVGRWVLSTRHAGVNVLGPYRARDGGGKRFSRASILSSSDGHFLIVWAYKKRPSGCRIHFHRSKFFNDFSRARACTRAQGDVHPESRRNWVTIPRTERDGGIELKLHTAQRGG